MISKTLWYPRAVWSLKWLCNIKIGMAMNLLKSLLNLMGLDVCYVCWFIFPLVKRHSLYSFPRFTEVSQLPSVCLEIFNMLSLLFWLYILSSYLFLKYLNAFFSIRKTLYEDLISVSLEIFSHYTRVRLLKEVRIYCF